MIDISLKEFLRDHSQIEAAQLLGIGQSAVSQMVSADRDVRLVLDDHGNLLESYERKPVGRRAIENAA